MLTGAVRHRSECASENRLGWLVLVLVLGLLAGGCGFGLQSGHFDELAQLEPVMTDYEPEGMTLVRRGELEADGPFGLGDPQSASLTQNFALEDPPSSQQELEQAMESLRSKALADAAAAGWVFSDDDHRGRYYSTSSTPGSWTLVVSTAGKHLLVEIYYYPGESG